MRHQPAPGPCWCVRASSDAGQVIAGGGSRRCQRRAADRRERRDGADHVRQARRSRSRPARRCRRRAGIAYGLPRIPPAGACWSDSSRWTASPVTAEASASATRLAVRRHGAVRGGECGGASASFHRQARGSRDPARLRHVLARCRRVAADASRRPAGRLGFFARHRHARRSTTSVRRRATAGW